MRTGTGTGNGKREMGNGKQGTEEGKMRTKPFLIPYPQTIKSPIADFYFNLFPYFIMFSFSTSLNFIRLLRVVITPSVTSESTGR